ncbi:NAD-dependent malic enzyme [Myxococcota bacterium]|nr:NAD-dependent malic enzyme [Myxococcota bacterium]
MIDIDEVEGPEGLEIHTRHHGIGLLEIPILNKGTAFTPEERRDLALTGLLPPHESTVAEQLARTYENYLAKTSDLEKHVYLNALHDRNETLFFRLVKEHITEMMPVVYTPVVGQACQLFSHVYRRPRGLFISPPNLESIDEILDHRPYKDVEVIVVTDGERILGLGDQGAGGMGIPIGKLALYTVCGGIHPARTLPIVLDVGTNNPTLINDPLYLGWRHERIRGKEYTDFVEAFVASVKRKLPNVLLQWEDFANNNAFAHLEKYRDELCTFNDDIQGTAAVTYSALLAAVKVTGSTLAEQRIVLLGAGSAGVGICDLMLEDMKQRGQSRKDGNFWLIDSQGLVHDGRAQLPASKARWARPAAELTGWEKNEAGEVQLMETIRRVKPTVLVGVSGQPGAFPEAVIREMAKYVERPIIFPLSNPTSKVEAKPVDLLAWTNGRALIATGSPFGAVMHEGKAYPIGQCNNSYIFPGVGLGTIAVRSRRVTDQMFLAAAKALAERAPTNKDPTASLLPPLETIRDVSMHVAKAVARQAVKQGLADPLSDEQISARIEKKWWEPVYRRVRRKR